MLLMRARVRPCSARLVRSSLGRVTRRTLAAASKSTLILGWTLSDSGPPLGPFTLTSWPDTSTVTPAGMTTGCLPIRDIAVSNCGNRRDEPGGSLPNRTKKLAAQALGAGVAVAHDPLAGAQ